MKQADSSVPAYVDTQTPAKVWYGYHLSILTASLAMAAIAALILEYELAKLRNPGVAFYATPTTFDLIVSVLVLLLAVANVGVLIFVFWRHLWLRRWMLGTTIFGWMLIATLVIVLNYTFLPVLLPWYR